MQCALSLLQGFLGKGKGISVLLSDLGANRKRIVRAFDKISSEDILIVLPFEISFVLRFGVEESAISSLLWLGAPRCTAFVCDTIAPGNALTVKYL